MEISDLTKHFEKTNEGYVRVVQLSNAI